MNTNKRKMVSRTLAALDALGVPYVVKGHNAELVEMDSLKITLGGKFHDSWYRWSTKESGKDARSLVTYLLKQGTVDKAEALNYLGGKLSTYSKMKVLEVEQPKTVDFDNIVYNPRAYEAKEYLTEQRKLNPILVDAVFSRGNIIEDARDNVVFLLKDKDGNRTGGEVVGIKPLADGKRLRYLYPNSKGMFYLLSKDCKNFSDVENVVFFEGVIDLLSFVEMSGYSNNLRQKIPYTLPEQQKKTLFVSLSGSLTKVETMSERISQYDVDLNKVNIVVATDNDEPGDEAFFEFEKKYPSVSRVRADSRTVPVKDWNDLLKLVKAGDSDGK